jgi:GrpB-like predicted nucleotidyltransferase (UPF0157 family)
MSEPVIIVDYDPNWAHVFSELRDMLATSLGNLPLAIEHVGSTSIPGAAAKPIIDIDVVIRSRSELNQTIQALETIGYRHVGDLGIPGREAFEAPPNLPEHHLYVVIYGNSEYTRHLRFRNYLRKHPEMTEQYSALKKSLATIFRYDRDAFTQAKTAFIEEVLQRAKEGSD